MAKRKRAFFRKRLRGGKGCFGKADFARRILARGLGTGRSGSSSAFVRPSRLSANRSLQKLWPNQPESDGSLSTRL
ncbi:hypothetical protein EME01_62660 [Sinorhizobium meliloti]|nr:hypothetical protein EME01_62660 [Sinorhizobium meliloti]